LELSFGVTALGTAPVIMVGNGGTGAIAILAPYLFVGSNVAVGIVVLATLRLMMQGRRLAQAPSTTQEPRAT